MGRRALVLFIEVNGGCYEEVTEAVTPGQDLVSLAMETSKVVTSEESHEVVPDPTEVIQEAVVIDEDYPDEI